MPLRFEREPDELRTAQIERCRAAAALSWRLSCEGRARREAREAAGIFPPKGPPVKVWLPDGMPLAPDELARRSERDAFALANADAYDPECPVCVAMGAPCAAELARRRNPELAERTYPELPVTAAERCYHCEGKSRVYDPQRGRWSACPWCNAAPPYPGVLPGGLAREAYRLAEACGLVPKRSAAKGARDDYAARMFWLSYGSSRRCPRCGLRAHNGPCTEYPVPGT